MSVIDWLLLQTPDGSSYLQIIIVLTILFVLVKYLLIPDLKEFFTIQGDDSIEENTDYTKEKQE